MTDTFLSFLPPDQKQVKMSDKKSLAKNGEDMTNEWLSEAIISFLKGPCYSVPLMSFIDEHCLVFDLEEENKFEYTTLHIEFMKLVDKLLCELLEDLGVQPEKLVSVLSSDVNSDQISSFVLTSILSVEDFLQFKAMMVKRNVELTNQVIESLIEKKEEEAAKAAEEKKRIQEEKERKERELEEEILAENGQVDEETMKVLKLSKQQFEFEKEQRKIAENADFSEVNGAEDQEEAFERALKESLKVKAKIDQEKAELEQALALSLALEKEAAETREAAREAEGEVVVGYPVVEPESIIEAPNEAENEEQQEAETESEENSKELDLPVVAEQVQDEKPAGEAEGSQSLEEVEVDIKQDASEKLKNSCSLPPLNLDKISSAPSTAAPTPGSSGSSYRQPLNSSRFHGAGYRSDSVSSLKTPTSAASSSSDGVMDAIREAAYAAAETQKGLLQTRKENLLIREKEVESTATKVSDLDTKKKDYIIKQRAALVAKNNAERQKQLADFLLSSKENLFPKARETTKETKKSDLPPIQQSEDQSQDQQRAALRHELAKMFKQQLLGGM